MAALLASLADWRTMPPWGREALRRATQGATAMHWECEWAAMLAKVLRAGEREG
ncbi:MAG: hypothetical protein M3Y05_10940 [Gemmatimonadota bacterium]|nr:hypothetical protein [Gemmatimonadota bacterium]